MEPEFVCVKDSFMDEVNDVEEYLINEGYNIEELLRNAEEMVGRMRGRKTEIRSQKSEVRNKKIEVRGAVRD